METIPLIERRKLVKSGSSVVVTVPAEWLREHKLHAGDEVMMVANGCLKFLEITPENIEQIRTQLSEHSQAGSPAKSEETDGKPFAKKID